MEKYKECKEGNHSTVPYPCYAEYHQLIECTQSYLVAVPCVGVAKPLDVVEDEPGQGDDHENDEGDGDKHY